MPEGRQIPEEKNVSTICKIILLTTGIFFAVLGYACCMVAHTSDEMAERMYRDYEKWKQKKEREKK